MEAQKKLFIGGNWKSNNTHAQTDALVADVLKKLAFDHNKVGRIFGLCRCRRVPHFLTTEPRPPRPEGNSRAGGRTELLAARLWSLHRGDQVLVNHM